MGSRIRKVLIDRIYPALSKHEIGTSEDRELVVLTAILLVTDGRIGNSKPFSESDK